MKNVCPVPHTLRSSGWKVNSGEDRCTTRWTPEFVKSTPSALCWDRLQFHVWSSCSSWQEVAAATLAKPYPILLSPSGTEWYRSLLRNERQCFSEIWNRIHPHVLEYQDEHLWCSFHQSQGKTVSRTMNLIPGTTFWQRIHTRRELLEMHLWRTHSEGRSIRPWINDQKERRESELSSCFSPEITRTLSPDEQLVRNSSSRRYVQHSTVRSVLRTCVWTISWCKNSDLEKEES